jgi:hypothetical protein
MLYHHTMVIKEWRNVAGDVLCRTTLTWRHIIGIWDKTQKPDVGEWTENIAWRHTQNVVPSEYCTHFNSTLAICLRLVFIEMFDKCITYIVWWYKTVYQVLSVAWTNRITTRRFRDSKWYWFTQQIRPDTKSCTTTLCM